MLNQGSAKIRGMSSRTRLVAAALSCLTPWFAAAPRAAAGDLAQIMARGSVRVLAGADEDPAWFSIRKSESPGFEREVLEGFARLHKLRFEAVPVARWRKRSRCCCARRATSWPA